MIQMMTNTMTTKVKQISDDASNCLACRLVHPALHFTRHARTVGKAGDRAMVVKATVEVVNTNNQREIG